MNRFAQFVLKLALVPMLLCLSACVEEDVDKADYFPLRDGNHWEYRLLDRPLLGRLNAGQAIVTSATADTRPDDPDIEAPAEVVPDDKNAAKNAPPAIARRVSLDLQAAVDDLTYKALYDTAEQVWSKRNGYVGFQNTGGRNYLLILPPHTHYRWVVTSGNGKNLYCEIETARGEVSVPAGKFINCAVARHESRDRKEIFKYWFAPGVGMIRRSKYFSGEEVFRQELVEYKVQPARAEARMAEEKEVRKAVYGKNRGNEFKARDKAEERATRLDDLDQLNKQNEKAAKDYAPK